MTNILLGYSLDCKEASSCAAWLSPQELALAETMSVPRARQFLNGRAITRQMIQRCCELPPEQIDIELPSMAAPRLWLSKQPCHFSLSHSRQAIAVAIGFEQPVGVDIEHVRARSFTELSASMPALHGMNNAYDFYRRWTAVEAGSKLTGQHLADALQVPLPAKLRYEHLHLPDYVLCLAHLQPSTLTTLAL